MLLVITTFPSKETANDAARKLVEERLCACAQVFGPIESYYWWKGEVQHDIEWFLFLKTKEDMYPHLEKRLAEVHPYEVPEIIGLPVEKSYGPYVDWVFNVLKTSG